MYTDGRDTEVALLKKLWRGEKVICPKCRKGTLTHLHKKAKKRDWAYILAVILELGAVFFLVQSLLTVFPEGESNWYLPLALGLNCIALFLNAAQRRKNRKDA